MDFGHVALPVVLPWKSFASRSRVVAALNRTVKLALLLVSIVHVTHQVSLGTKAFATCWIGAFVILAVVSLVVLEFVGLVEDLVTARLVAAVCSTSG